MRLRKVLPFFFLSFFYVDLIQEINTLRSERKFAIQRSSDTSDELEAGVVANDFIRDMTITLGHLIYSE